MAAKKLQMYLRTGKIRSRFYSYTDFWGGQPHHYPGNGWEELNADIWSETVDWKKNSLNYFDWECSINITYHDIQVNTEDLLKALDTPARNYAPEKLKYITPDMQLMFDAVQNFWNHYDLDKPDKSKAPLKKDVLEWIIKEAKNRNIQDFSKSRAEVMDTIIRCPKSRGGGNTT
jgi:hypothetical protein